MRMRDVRAFHKKFGLEYAGAPRVLDPEHSQFRIKFMREELQEYINATEGIEQAIRTRKMDDLQDLMAQQLDALVDLSYVIGGTAHLHGYDFDKAWRRVHRANMAKVRARSANQSKRGSKLDVVKPAGWKAPSLVDLV